MNRQELLQLADRVERIIAEWSDIVGHDDSAALLRLVVNIHRLIARLDRLADKLPLTGDDPTKAIGGMPRIIANAEELKARIQYAADTLEGAE